MQEQLAVLGLVLGKADLDGFCFKRGLKTSHTVI